MLVFISIQFNWGLWLLRVSFKYIFSSIVGFFYNSYKNDDTFVLYDFIKNHRHKWHRLWIYPTKVLNVMMYTIFSFNDLSNWFMPRNDFNLIKQHENCATEIFQALEHFPGKTFLPFNIRKLVKWLFHKNLTSLHSWFWIEFFC